MPKVYKETTSAEKLLNLIKLEYKANGTYVQSLVSDANLENHKHDTKQNKLDHYESRIKLIIP